MIFLAHRGLWTQPGQRNSRSAFRLAFEEGFGLETDIRDFDGQLVISHDMATKDALPLSAMLADYDAAGRPGRLALNIKADGLAVALSKELGAFEDMRRHAFVFDMSVPDMLHYFPTDVPVFTRSSEYESPPPLELQCQGIWMDCFVDPWADPAEVVRRLDRGQQVAIVSPELHNRTAYRSFWAILKKRLSQSQPPTELLNDNLMLCTDFPREAAKFFREDLK